MSVPHQRPVSLSLSSSITPRPLPPGPASPRSCPSATLTPSPVSPTPIALPYSCSPHHPCHPRSSPSPIQPLPAAPSFPPLHQPPSPPSPSSTWTHPSQPPFSLSLLHPARPPILRSHRCPIALFSMPFTRARAPSPSLPMLQAREALSGTGHCATPPVWEPPLPPPRPHGELRLPRVFSVQISSAPYFPSIYRCSRCWPPPPPTNAAHRRSPECRCPEPPRPPLRRAAASVCPHRYHLACHFPIFTLELLPPVPPHLVARLDAGGCATTRGPVRGDHPVCAPRRIDQQARPPLWPWAAERGRLPCPLRQRPWAGSSPTLCPSF
jgi:hypothetical protein